MGLDPRLWANDPFSDVSSFYSRMDLAVYSRIRLPGPLPWTHRWASQSCGSLDAHVHDRIETEEPIA